MMQTIQARQALPENLNGYGSIARLSGEVAPTSEASEYRFWSDLAHCEITGESEIGICTVFSQPKFEVSSLEAHTGTPELLIPIDRPFIVPLLREGAGEAEVEAFRVEVGEAIVINPGVWHGACLPAESDVASYFVIFRRGTPKEDVCKRTIAPLGVSWWPNMGQIE